MSITYPTSIIDNRLLQVAQALDSGSSNGILTILSTNNSVMANVVLSKPSVTINSSIGRMDFNNTPFLTTVLIDGAATSAKFTTTEGNTVISLTAGTGSTSFDLIFSPTNVMAAGQQFAFSFGQITGR